MSSSRCTSSPLDRGGGRHARKSFQENTLAGSCLVVVIRLLQEEEEEIHTPNRVAPDRREEAPGGRTMGGALC